MWHPPSRDVNSIAVSQERNALCLFPVTVVGLLCIVLLSCVYLCYLMCIVLLRVCIAVLHTLVAGLLARSQYPEGPATGHLGIGFSSFPCVHKRMLRWFPRLQLLLHASHVALLT